MHLDIERGYILDTCNKNYTFPQMKAKCVLIHSDPDAAVNFDGESNPHCLMLYNYCEPQQLGDARKGVTLKRDDKILVLCSGSI